MALIKKVNGVGPKFGEGIFLADNATVVGDVVMGKDCSVWFNAVVRGDVHSIIIGDRVNVQDGAIIHCTYETDPTVIGNDVSIAHNAIVHGCTIKDNVLIGMGAIVMDGCVVESNCIITSYCYKCCTKDCYLTYYKSSAWSEFEKISCFY